MNKIGFGELLIILVIALIVLGPDKLPQAARALGKAIGSVKKYVREASEELQIDELKQIKKDVVGIRTDLKSMGDSIEQSIMTDAEKIDDEMQSVTQSVNDAVENDTPPAAPQTQPKAEEPSAAPAPDAAPAADTTLPHEPSDTPDETQTISQEEHES